MFPKDIYENIHSSFIIAQAGNKLNDHSQGDRYPNGGISTRKNTDMHENLDDSHVLCCPKEDRQKRIHNS